jgi:hypothetical protein
VYERERARGDVARHGPGFGQWAGSGARGPFQKINHFPIYFLKNSNNFTFLSNKNPFSQVSPKIKVV